MRPPHPGHDPPRRDRPVQRVAGNCYRC